MLFSEVFSSLGYETMPKTGESYDDIICSIKFGDEQKLIEFCRAVQSASPIDSFAAPEPWDMPGYGDKVIMAAGRVRSGRVYRAVVRRADTPAVHGVFAGRAYVRARRARA